MATEKEKKDESRKVEFNYLKSNLFRMAHVDGVIGSLTPKHDVFMSFYNERLAMPDRMVFEISEDGKLTDPPIDVETDSKGIMRELEIGIVMDIETARAFAQWLTGMVAQADTMWPDEILPNERKKEGDDQ